MRAKPDLVPDCDVDGEPMYRDECAASALGLKGDREEVVWRCPHAECGRYFHGTVGYRSHITIAGRAIPTPRCEREGAFLVVQHTLGSYICPVAGCPMAAGCAFLCVHHRREGHASAPALLVFRVGDPVQPSGLPDGHIDREERAVGWSAAAKCQSGTPPGTYAVSPASNN